MRERESEQELWGYHQTSPGRTFMERKYRQRGYSDAEAREKKRERADRPAEQQQPRPKQEMLGRRTPRVVRPGVGARVAVEPRRNLNVRSRFPRESRTHWRKIISRICIFG